jgi:uncharacterized protein YlxW (UPF0749 family)
MAESVNVTSTILDKKIEHYDWKAKDFVAEGELTITITLAEYRALVASEATKQNDIAKANADKYERDAENTRLKEEVNSLRAKLYEIQNNTSDGGI